MRRIDDRDTCRYLRTKGMYVEAEPDPAVPETGSGLCWCVHTQNQLGPDGKVAEPTSCGPGRRCYEAK
ncbi:MAG TPA: hypothetical protein VLF66_20185 [Thermoanaerobaculia bacterium]|nr:hypothetical protein [Thermoanaerobaculia bacterium]